MCVRHESDPDTQLALRVEERVAAPVEHVHEPPLEEARDLDDPLIHEGASQSVPARNRSLRARPAGGGGVASDDSSDASDDSDRDM